LLDCYKSTLEELNTGMSDDFLVMSSVYDRTAKSYEREITSLGNSLSKDSKEY
jgi:hypothetical protein